MDRITIELNNQTYEGKLDFATLGKIQANLKKELGQAITIQEIFEGVANQDFNIINEIVVCSIQRVHKQIKRENILEKMNFNNMEAIFKFITDLFQDAIPQTGEEGLEK